MKQKLLISFSGGRTSAFMCWWLLNKWEDRDKWEIIVVFANTGKENIETLDFVNDCDQYFGFNIVWVEGYTNPIRGFGVSPRVVNYEVADRAGVVFRNMVAKHGMPSVKSPHCTRELKARTIRAYAKSIGWKKYYTAIGIRVDEIDRVSLKHKEERLIYPLVSMVPTRKNDVNKFWSKQMFDLQLKSYEGNCDLCFKKSDRKLLTILRETPWKAGYYQDLELEFSNYIPEGRKQKLKPPLYSYRRNRSILQLIEMAKNDFELAVDDSQYFPEYKQLSLFGELLDTSNGCIESCEVF